MWKYKSVTGLTWKDAAPTILANPELTIMPVRLSWKYKYSRIALFIQGITEDQSYKLVAGYS